MVFSLYELTWLFPEHFLKSSKQLRHIPTKSTNQDTFSKSFFHDEEDDSIEKVTFQPIIGYMYLQIFRQIDQDKLSKRVTNLVYSTVHDKVS